MKMKKSNWIEGLVVKRASKWHSQADAIKDIGDDIKSFRSALIRRLNKMGWKPYRHKYIKISDVKKLIRGEL